MSFYEDFYNEVSCSIRKDLFSFLLSEAVSKNQSIRKIQTKDTPEQWGISGSIHRYCYGRHLFYCTKNNLTVPFWIGLDIRKNDTFISLIFDNKLFNALFTNFNLSNFNSNYSLLQKNTNKSSSIEIHLIQKNFKDICDSNDSQILSDFMNDILSKL